MKTLAAERLFNSLIETRIGSAVTGAGLGFLVGFGGGVIGESVSEAPVPPALTLGEIGAFTVGVALLALPNKQPDSVDIT